jgi:hypothetical protein
MRFDDIGLTDKIGIRVKGTRHHNSSQNPQDDQDGHNLNEGKPLGIPSGHFSKHKNLSELPK